MKRWAVILLAVVALWLIAGLLHIIPPIVNPFDNPRYASGEATAMVERIRDIPWHRHEDIVTEKYLGRGAWEVRIIGSYDMLVFTVYETSGTVDEGKVVVVPYYPPAPPTPFYVWGIIAIEVLATIAVIVLIVKKTRIRRVS